MLTSVSAPTSVRSTQAKRVRIGLAVAAGTAAAYGAVRFLSYKNRTSRASQHSFMRWLSTRLRELSGALGLTAELSDKVAKEIRRASRISMKLANKAQRTKPDVGDLLLIIAEKRFLAMKQRLHRMLDLTEASQLQALRDFYSEIRTRIFGTEGRAEGSTMKLQSTESV